MRVLHVLANGPPDVNGYAIRTKMTKDITVNYVSAKTTLALMWEAQRKAGLILVQSKLKASVDPL